MIVENVPPKSHLFAVDRWSDKKKKKKKNYANRFVRTQQIYLIIGWNLFRFNYRRCPSFFCPSAALTFPRFAGNILRFETREGDKFRPGVRVDIDERPLSRQRHGKRGAFGSRSNDRIAFQRGFKKHFPFSRLQRIHAAVGRSSTKIAPAGRRYVEFAKRERKKGKEIEEKRSPVSWDAWTFINK